MFSEDYNRPDSKDDGSLRSRGQPNGFKGIKKDVDIFRALLTTHFHADAKSYVGKEGSEWMTKNRFTGLVKSQLLEPTPDKGARGPSYYALYVLYYSGHGDGSDGHFCAEKNEIVTLDNILKVWMDSAPCKAGASKLLIVADSCFSGAMAARLRRLCDHGKDTREAAAARKVAIQAACGPKEVTYDGSFISAYMGYAENQQKVRMRQLLAEAGHPGLPSGGFPVGRIHFYCPWGAKEMDTGTKDRPFLLYQGKASSGGWFGW